MRSWCLRVATVTVAAIAIASLGPGLAAQLTANIAMSHLVRLSMACSIDDPWTVVERPQLAQIASDVGRAVTCWPSNPGLQTAWVRILWFSGQPEQVVKISQQIGSVCQSSSLVGYYVGWAYEQEGMSGAAVNVWRESGVPADAFLLMRSRVELRGDRTKLVRLAEIASNLESRSSREIVRAAADYERWGLHPQAIALWQKLVVLLPPDTADYWYARGESSRLQGDVPTARQSFQRGRSLAPDESRFYEREVAVLLKAGEIRDAVPVAIAWVDKFPQDVYAYYSLGEAYRLLPDLPRAKKWFAEALVVDPSYAPAARRLGNIAVQEGAWPRAVEWLRRAIALDPEYDNAYFDLGQALFALGNTEEAVTMVQRAISLFKAARCPVAWYRELGMMYEQMGQVDQSIAAYRSAVECDPNESTSRQRLLNLLGH